MKQSEVKRYAKKELKNYGYNPILQDGFLYAEGNVPVMLLAHMDTVFKNKPENIKRTGSILSASAGLGADDRAGIYAILDIVDQGFLPHILLLEDEEIGGVGAKMFTKSGIKPKINYMVELDRRGVDDAVFYDCDNVDFTNYILSFGFKDNYGSFSDISTVAPYLGIAGVNLSIGYSLEHTKSEFLSLDVLTKTIEKVTQMLSDNNIVVFEYIESYSSDYERYLAIYSQYTSNKKKKRKSKIKSTPKYCYDDGTSSIPCTYGYIIECDGTIIDASYSVKFALGSDDRIYTYAGQVVYGAEWVDDDWNTIFFERAVEEAEKESIFYDYN